MKSEEKLSIYMHNLRQPLNTIRNSSELLRMDLEIALHGSLPSEIQSYLDFIEQAVEQADTTLRNLTDSIYLDSSKGLLLSKENLHEQLKAAFSAIEPKLTFKQTVLQPSLMAENCFVMADRERLQRAFYNILLFFYSFCQKENTFKVKTYNKENEILVLLVIEKGNAVPDGFMRLINEAQQPDTVNLQTQKGFAMDLYVSKHILEMHGGSIKLEEVLEEGNTLTVRLPTA